MKNCILTLDPQLLYNSSISKGDKVEIMNNSEEYKNLQHRENELAYIIVELLKQQNDINAKLFLARREYRDVCDQLSELNMQEQNSDESIEDEQQRN